MGSGMEQTHCKPNSNYYYYHRWRHEKLDTIYKQKCPYAIMIHII
jgi:hypothetical protein